MVYLTASPTYTVLTHGMTARLSAKHMQWQFAAPVHAELVTSIAHQCHLSPWLARIIVGRGYTTASMVNDFLARSDPHHDPLIMHDMTKAAQRIIQAITTQEPMAVYGDFDADGITATSLICDALRQLGAHIAPYIPHRTGEGYGLNTSAIDRLAASGVRLLLTVDCGISNKAEVAYAQSLGLDVVVTDHHTPPDDLPVATAVVNPRLAFCPYPDKGLVGVGVAYKLVQAIGQLGMPLPSHAMYELLDLVALGTIADLGPLTGENRAFVADGLVCMAQSMRPGIIALRQVAGLDGMRINADDVAFKLAPRINAAGRLDDAAPAYELLLASDIATATQYATTLNDINTQRQQFTKALQERIAADVVQIGRHHDTIIVHADPDAHAGLVGLVAARIADQFARPTIIIEQGIPTSRGSARAAGMLNMVEALRNCGVDFVKMGGHAAAAGFTIETRAIDDLRQALLSYAEANNITTGIRTLTIDCELDAAELDMTILTDITALEPCGQHNSTPNFLTRYCRVISARTICGDGKHLQLKLDMAGHSVTAIAWGEGHQVTHFDRIKAIDVVYQPHLNEWNGKRELRLDIRDFRSARGPTAPPYAQ